MLELIDKQETLKKQKEVRAMGDKDKFVNIADLKAKLRYWCKTRGVTKAAQDNLMETIKRIPYTVKADIKATLDTTEKGEKHDKS
jgi:hypothetical protein